MKKTIKSGLLLTLVTVFGSLLSADPALAAHITNPPASISHQVVVVLHKDLSGFDNYGTDGRADVLYSTESGSWGFDLASAGLTGNDVAFAEVRAALVLDDHYNRAASEYNGSIRLGGTTLFSGSFVSQGIQHGDPFGQRFNNWHTVSFGTASKPAGSIWNVGITNGTSGAVGRDWIAIDSIELRVTLRR